MPGNTTEPELDKELVPEGATEILSQIFSFLISCELELPESEIADSGQ